MTVRQLREALSALPADRDTYDIAMGVNEAGIETPVGLDEEPERQLIWLLGGEL